MLSLTITNIYDILLIPERYGDDVSFWYRGESWGRV